VPERVTSQKFRDIYRSDLGEILLTLYFDIENGEFGKDFIIPVKNIWDRELNDLPGRGLDLTGYMQKDGIVEILLGEAKVWGAWWESWGIDV